MWDSGEPRVSGRVPGVGKGSLCNKEENIRNGRGGAFSKANSAPVISHLIKRY